MLSNFDAPYVLEFELPSLPPMTNRASGASNHWRHIHAERKRWRETVATIARVRRPSSPLERAKLTLTRCSSVCPDADGLVSGFKPIVDGLVDGGVLRDDKLRTTGMPDYRWESAPKGLGKVRIRVEAVA